MYSCYLYVFGCVLPEGRPSAQEAFDYGKSKGFGFCLHDPKGRHLISWDPIRGPFDRQADVKVV